MGHVQSLDLSSKTASLRNRLAQQSAGVLEDDLLTKNSTLLHLNLASTNLGFGGAQGLARGLVGNHTLQSLDISQNDIGDRGGTCVAAALKDCGLLDLNLADNRIGFSRVFSAYQSEVHSSTCDFWPDYSSVNEYWEPE
ncbi:unnamed protein product [Effrenium voratum]|nr:unnamed protein product [Effrenium voratum]